MYLLSDIQLLCNPPLWQLHSDSEHSKVIWLMMTELPTIHEWPYFFLPNGFILFFGHSEFVLANQNLMIKNSSTWYAYSPPSKLTWLCLPFRNAYIRPLASCVILLLSSSPHLFWTVYSERALCSPNCEEEWKRCLKKWQAEKASSRERR